MGARISGGFVRNFWTFACLIVVASISQNALAAKTACTISILEPQSVNVFGTFIATEQLYIPEGYAPADPCSRSTGALNMIAENVATLEEGSKINVSVRLERGGRLILTPYLASEPFPAAGRFEELAKQEPLLSLNYMENGKCLERKADMAWVPMKINGARFTLVASCIKLLGEHDQAE